MQELSYFDQDQSNDINVGNTAILEMHARPLWTDRVIALIAGAEITSLKSVESPRAVLFAEIKVYRLDTNWVL